MLAALFSGQRLRQWWALSEHSALRALLAVLLVTFTCKRLTKDEGVLFSSHVNRAHLKLNPSVRTYGNSVNPHTLMICSFINNILFSQVGKLRHGALR